MKSKSKLVLKVKKSDYCDTVVLMDCNATINSVKKAVKLAVSEYKEHETVDDFMLEMTIDGVRVNPFMDVSYGDPSGSIRYLIDKCRRKNNVDTDK